MNALLAAVVLAATPITLQEVRQESRNNLQTLLAELDRVRASEQVRVARSPILPQLSVSTTAGRTLTQSGDPIVISGQAIPGTGSSAASNSFTLGATLNQLLFDLGRFSALRNAGFLAEAAQGTAKEQMLASEFEAIKRFYALWTAQKQLAVLEATAAKSAEFADRAEALFQAGRGTKGDALSARVNLGNDRISAQKQRAVVVQAQSDLASWLGRSETPDFEAVDPALSDAPPPPDVDLDRGLELARTNRPLLVQYGAQVRAADANVTTQAAGWAPRVGFQLAYQRYATDFGKVYGNFDKYGNLTGTFSLNWDLFSGFQTDALTKQARAQAAQARLNLAQSERDVEGQVRVALESLKAQLQALAEARANREAAAQNLDFFQERFRAGAAATIDVRDAQIKLQQAYQTLIQTRADVETARAALDKATGILGNGVTP